VDSVEANPEGCRVIVDYSLEKGTMRVPPDVFNRMKEFADMVNNERMIFNAAS
jgi:hypothetical protein